MQKWVKGLPGSHTTIISLLGHKRDGTSEFSFYSFGGKDDNSSEARGKKPFQQWLDDHCAEKDIRLLEYPTTDFESIRSEILEDIARDVPRLLAEDRTIVLMDSGGETRTRSVCRCLGLVEDSTI